MSDEILYYIIIGAVYVLYSWLKGKKQSGSAPPEVNRPSAGQPARQASPPPKQLTFEELLREITEAKQPAPQQESTYHPSKQPKSEYVDYDEDIEDEIKNVEEARDLEDEEFDYGKKEPVYDQYEQAKREAFYRPSLEETTRLEDVKMDFGRFKVFDKEQQRNLLEEYTRDLRDPEGLKKAVILSEIITRKHF